jgi:ATP-dependent DNA helicase DinG
VSTVSELIERAYERLSELPGFVDRPNQKQLSLLVSDFITEETTGAIEAPTGLGKSLAALIPAIAQAIVEGKRTVIATYTNVLAEQYWRKDLPLALSLFDDPDIKTAFVIGRQRYACLTSMYEHAAEWVNPMLMNAELGIETEFRQLIPLKQRDLTTMWRQIAAPPVCPARLCPNYQECFYYRGRRQGEKAHIVITNHSVVIQSALVARSSDDGKGMLGEFDFLVLDEAHDFPQAAINGMEFELSANHLGILIGIANRIESSLMPMAKAADEGEAWHSKCKKFRDGIDQCQKALVEYSMMLGQPGILALSPAEVQQHPQVRGNQAKGGIEAAKAVANLVSGETHGFCRSVEEHIQVWKDSDLGENFRLAQDTAKHYLMYVREIGGGANLLFDPHGVSVTYAGRSGAEAMIRQDVIGLAEPLQELIWEPTPWVCLSATLATDGNFEYFRRATGADPQYEEILPTPFDYGSNSSLYLPKAGRIPDPAVARREGTEDFYYRALAKELSEIIRACDGRTLALFHSRKEMEGVLQHVDLPPELPIYLQGKFGAGSIGERFKDNTHASLFALRSFWTGFDAPGETLSCVALVRVPFEVPIDPPQIARLAWMQTQGLDAFGGHTLALAKMMMRQGAGRLIRKDGDKGVVALLDPRLRSKRYGEEILANLPPEMRTFDDIYDAVAWIGLESRQLL